MASHAEHVVMVLIMFRNITQSRECNSRNHKNTNTSLMTMKQNDLKMCNGNKNNDADSGDNDGHNGDQ